MPKQNCWEVIRCGREPGGRRVDDLGICPAATEERLDGVHGGTNAGRACWTVAGTMCHGKVCGTHAMKIGDCAQCEFHKKMSDEEFPHLLPTSELLRRLE